MSPAPVNQHPECAVGCSVAVVPSGAPETTMDNGNAPVVSASVSQLVRSAVLRGLCLDDPWRHAYLRNRWIGHGIGHGSDLGLDMGLTEA
jgi:hypothetical protein